MWRKKKQLKPAVGFFKDVKGETRPITKSIAELNRRKLIANPQAFQGINPQVSKVESNIRQLQKTDQSLEQHLQKQGGRLEELKNEFLQLQQQDPEKALGVEKNIKKTVFIIDSLSKKRVKVQDKLKGLDRIRSRMG